MMTVISSVFGMIPLAFGEGAGTELYRGMGTALIGGLSISTILLYFSCQFLYPLPSTWASILPKMIWLKIRCSQNQISYLLLPKKYTLLYLIGQ